MDTAVQWVNLILNACLIVYLIQSALRKRSIEEPADKLITLVTQISSLWEKQNWDKTSQEISALEKIYEQKANAAIEAFKSENLESAKSMKISEMKACYEFEVLSKLIQDQLSVEYRSHIYALLLNSGYSPAEKFMATFYTSDQDIGKAIKNLGEHFVQPEYKTNIPPPSL